MEKKNQDFEEDYDHNDDEELDLSSYFERIIDERESKIYENRIKN